jgi:hypothetical protein
MSEEKLPNRSKNENSKNDNDDHIEHDHSAILRSSTIFNVLRVMCNAKGR